MSSRGPDEGLLFVVTGPSGVGKSTLISHVRNAIPSLQFSVSATTRQPRQGEVDGVDYFFLTKEEFERRLECDAFLEHATVYDHQYGTLLSATEQARSSGKSIVLDIDLRGARQVRANAPHAILIFILPPSIDTLEQRLVARGSDSPTVIAQRMTQVAEQIMGCGEFDYLVLNDDLAIAKEDLLSIFLAEFGRRAVRDAWVTRAVEQAAARTEK